MFRVLLVTSPTRFLVIPLTVLGASILWFRSHYWVGVWPETGAAFGMALYFMGLIAAAASGWVSARLDQHGLREQAEQANTHSVGKVECYRFVSHLMWLSVPAIPVALLALWSTGRIAGLESISFFLAYTLSALTLNTLGICVGWLAGRVLPPLVAGSVAALTWFIITSIASATSSLYPVSGPPWLEVSPVTLWVRLALVLAVIAMVATLPARVSARRNLRVSGAIAALSVVIVVATIAGTNLLVPRPSPQSPNCFKGAVNYCLWPEHALYEPAIRDVDAKLTSLPHDFLLPPQIVDYGMVKRTVWIDGIEHELPGTFPPELLISEGSRWSIADSLSRAVVGETVARCENQVDEDPRLPTLQLQAWIETRLAGGGEPDYRTNAPDDVLQATALGRAMAEQSEPAQQAWAVSLLNDYLDAYC